MSSRTAIAWTDATWNPVTGCSHVSPGCEHCYAERLSSRFGWTAQPWRAQHAAENVRFHPDRLDWPLRRQKAQNVFVCSMGDLFHERIADEQIDQVFAAMLLCPHLVFQVLTKRAERMRRYVAERLDATDRYLRAALEYLPVFPGRGSAGEWREAICDDAASGVPLDLETSNIWLGVSVEDQRRADERIPLLLQTPASIRFLSCEPLLGPVDLRVWLDQAHSLPANFGVANQWHSPIDWVIAGGESGFGRRPMDLDWARSIRDACGGAAVPFFFKGSGGARQASGGDLLDGATWHEFPRQPPAA